MNAVDYALRKRRSDLRAVEVFCLVTAVLSITVLLLLPGYAGAAMVVFIPMVTAVLLIGLTAGKNQIQPSLFSRKAWHVSFKWLLISLGVALMLRLGVSVLGLLLVPAYQWQPGSFSPLLLMTLIFAAGEEIGWRGYALPTLLKHGFHPLYAALLLGIPWALLHLPLVLPGMLSAGTPPLSQFLVMMALSLMLTWIYLSGENSLSTAVLLHGGQNIFVIFNNGLDPVASGWLMASVYGMAALIIVLLTKGRMGLAGGQRETGVLER